MRIGPLVDLVTWFAYLVRSGLRDIVRNRWLALASIVAAVVLWAVIEDVENPRLEAVVPSEGYQPIPVEPLNLPDGLVLSENLTVRVRVKATSGDIAALTAADFEATIDVQDVIPGETVAKVVQVMSKRSNVDIVAVQPPDVLVTALEASSRELPVTVRIRGELPAGYRLLPGVAPVAEPSIVRVTGKSTLVESVETVELEANVTGVRESVLVTEGEFVARTPGGNRVDVQVAPARGRATVRIEQIVSQRLLPVLPLVTGSPAPGYRVTAITIEPATVTVSGPTEIVEGLKQVTVERLDISGAKNDVTQNKQLGSITNISFDRQLVQVKVEIKPFDCGSLTSSPCGRVTIYAAPTFENIPTGLVPQGTYSVAVWVSGPLPALNELRPSDVRVSANLQNAGPGVNSVQPTATIVGAPSGVTVDTVDRLNVTLTAGTGP